MISRDRTHVEGCAITEELEGGPVVRARRLIFGAIAAQVDLPPARSLGCGACLCRLVDLGRVPQLRLKATSDLVPAAVPRMS